MIISSFLVRMARRVFYLAIVLISFGTSADSCEAQTLNWQRLPGPMVSSIDVSQSGVPILFDQDSSGRLWVSTMGGIYHTSDYGKNWSILYKPYTLNSLLSFVVWSRHVNIAQKGSRQDHWAEGEGFTYSGLKEGFQIYGPELHGWYFFGTNGNGVLRTKYPTVTNYADQQSTFSNSVTAIILGPEPASVIAAGKGQVYRTLDTGATWQAYGPALDTFDITSLTYHDGVLHAGTREQGVYRLEGSEWKKLGGNTRPFRIGSILSDGARLLAAADGDGLFKWNASKQAWERYEQGLPSAPMRSLFLASDGSIILGSSHGIYRSKPGENTWEAIGLPTNIIQSFFPAKNGDLYTLTSEGLFKSQDDGMSWRDISHHGTSSYVYSLRESPRGELFAAADFGIYRSTNNGEKWHLMQMNVNFGGKSHNAIEVGDSNRVFAFGSGGWVKQHSSSTAGVTWYTGPSSAPNSVHLSRARNGVVVVSTGNEIYRTSDDGRTWALAFNIPNYYAGFIRDLIFLNDNEILVSRIDSGFLHSSDAGLTWTRYAPPIRFNYDGGADLGLFGNDILAATFRGQLERSTDKGKTWERIKALPDGKRVERFLAAPDYLLVAIDDKVYRSTDLGEKWQHLEGIYSAVNSLDTISNGDIYLSTQGSGLIRSTDRGLTWHMRSRGIGDPGAAWTSESWPMAVKGDTIVLREARSMYRSSDDGATWSKPDTNFYGGYAYNRFDVHPNGSMLWGGADSGLGVDRVSTDFGLTWNAPMYTTPDQRLYRVAYDSSGVAYALDYGRTYRQNSATEAWTHITEVPHDFNADIAASPDGSVYVTSQGKVYVSENGKQFVERSKGITTALRVAVDLGGYAYVVTGTAEKGYNVAISTDKGASWTMTRDTTFGLEDMHMIYVSHHNYVYALTNGGGIYRAAALGKASVERPRDRAQSVRHYPDPVIHTLNIEAEGDEVIILDASGREVLRQKLVGESVSFDVSDLAAGVYFYRVTGEGHATGKFIKAQQ
jgi:photosystem II stability/assembly factor-like uncharacterized protein